MKNFLTTVAGVLVGLLLFVFLAPLLLIGLVAAGSGGGAAAPRTVLALDLRAPMSDQPSANPFALLGAPRSLLDTLQQLDQASRDRRIAGLFIRGNTIGMAPAQAQELREAIAAFRASGRFVIAHFQDEGVRQSLAGYVAAAPADEIWLQEAGELLPMGISTEAFYLGDTMRRFHLTPQFEAREEYKSVANFLTESRMTPAEREETQAMMASVYETLIGAVARDRRLSAQAARAAIEATPMTAQAAVGRRLADRLGRPEDAEARALERAGRGARLMAMADYHPAPRMNGPVIAVVAGEGSIVTGPAQVDTLTGGAVMNSDALARALREAGEARDVRAIVFRVSSGGGSVVASDQIAHAVRDVRERLHRPVVVSMGEVAASGGYYVAADAHEIVASATTLTGSIGVIGGKVSVGAALEHYASVHTERLSVGSPVQGMASPVTPFSPAERAAFAGYVDRAYQEFVARVARGRRLDANAAREAARGRVWTGAQARERGLVDHLGGFRLAVARARALAEIPENAQVQLRFYPAARSPFQQIEAMLGARQASLEERALAAVLARRPEWAEAARAALAPPGVRAQANAPALR